MVRLIGLIMAMVLSLTACGEQRDERAPLVLAAASMQEALSAAADTWADKGYARPVISFAATSALARQIESGAKADIFVSADQDWMDSVERGGFIRAGSRVDLVGNDLVMIAPTDGIAALDLDGDAIGQTLGDGRIAIAEPEAVPAGRYGKAALEHLGLWAQFEDRIARGENVRAALALVERGEAPLGIVYATDAMASKRVRVVAIFPSESHPPITYPVALLGDASEEAKGFMEFLISPEGQAIFAEYGFSAPAN